VRCPDVEEGKMRSLEQEADEIYWRIEAATMAQQLAQMSAPYSYWTTNAGINAYRSQPKPEFTHFQCEYCGTVNKVDGEEMSANCCKCGAPWTWRPADPEGLLVTWRV
jgi:hypothetical protein